MQLLSWKGWHCRPQACAVIRLVLTDDQKPLLVSWFVSNAMQLDSYCKSERHCCCHTVRLMSCLQMNSQLLHVFDELLSASCTAPRTDCFLIPCIKTVYDLVTRNDLIQDIESNMQRLLRLRSSLPRNGSNFVGEADGSTFSSSVRWFILTFVKMLAAETKDKSWCQAQLVYLRDMIAQTGGDSDTENLVTKQMVRVFREDDVKLISVTKSMICILREVSGMGTADEMFAELADAIHCDHSVLVDWLTSDDETAVELLSLLLTYLKLPNDGISHSVRNMLIQLRDTCVRLTAKRLIPYNSEPLLRLMRKL